MIDRGANYDIKFGERSNEVKNQQYREADKFAYYERQNANRMNPVRETDEYFCKDERIACVDL